MTAQTAQIIVQTLLGLTTTALLYCAWAIRNLDKENEALATKNVELRRLLENAYIFNEEYQKQYRMLLQKHIDEVNAESQDVLIKLLSSSFQYIDKETLHASKRNEDLKKKININ